MVRSRSGVQIPSRAPLKNNQPTMNKNNIIQKVQVYIFKRTMRGYEFLILKRDFKNNNIWQPVTGKVEGKESILDGAKREVFEETGIKNFARIIDLDYAFNFKNKYGNFKEHCFGFEVSSDTEEISISDEHEKYSWMNFETVMEMIYWKSNKEALKLLYNKISHK